MALPVHLTYNVAGCDEVSCDYALLVVACDPRELADVIKDHTGHETQVNEKLVSFTIRTTLHRAKRCPGSKFAVRLNPGALDSNDYSVYGWRDEVRARKYDVGERGEAEEKGGEAFVVAYQMMEEKLVGADREVVKAKIEEKLEEGLAKSWTHFEVERREAELLTDYFPHFELDDLRDGLPWAVLDNQGQRATLYVSSFTCFESVLQCKQYGDMLWEQDQVRAVMPGDKDAPIAVIGAGPSGLLFASQQLVRKGGYTNVTVFEKEGVFGGKTRTVDLTTEEGVVVPCELGTCYLSDAYDDDLTDLSDMYESGKLEPLGGPNMRSIAETPEAVGSDEEEHGVEFQEWVKRKNGGEDWKTDLEAQAKVFAALLKYKKIHKAVMGTKYCMPLKKPERRRRLFVDDDVYEDALCLRFMDFLCKHGMAALEAPFLYTYEVQGYGDIKRIPAYYGLAWITADLAEGIIRSRLPIIGDGESVFVYDKGWLRLWEKIVERHADAMKVVLNANVLSITRD
ncbi:unnamed protein product [Ostreobium quekettii]|uniref:Amine oxidase domain-containing protein n=1 Tax=Ostreobium quekettii TaxID=121088 RepID=A0A8S1J348_9CHLO|nr:unnamed protein product [Ostreobium quekettii]|eukprot:evm.model.scf_193.9 EVM.evm.TU.scf_193.9   scf_193:99236-100768(-)